MELSDVFGWLATAASTARFVPQAWQIIKTRETKAISLHTYWITVAGFAMWLAYGAMLGRLPLILTNALCLVLSAFILVMKLLSPRARDAVADTLDVTAGS